MAYDIAAVAREIATLIRERRLDGYTMIGRTYLMDYGSAAAGLPVTNRGAMNRLCEVLRVERRWLFELCGMQVSSPAPKKAVVEPAPRRRAAVTAEVEAALKEKAAAAVEAREAAIEAATSDTKTCISCGETKLKAVDFYGRYDRTCKKCRCEKARFQSRGPGTSNPAIVPKPPGRPRRGKAEAGFVFGSWCL
jgi:hypothetical protein